MFSSTCPRANIQMKLGDGIHCVAAHVGMKLLHDHIPRPLIYTAIVVLALEVFLMALLITGAPVPPRSAYIGLHVVALFLMTYTAARILLRASAPGRFDVTMFVAFVAVLIIYNPFYLLILSASQIIAANLITVALLAWVACRRAAQESPSSARPMWR